MNNFFSYLKKTPPVKNKTHFMQVEIAFEKINC